jgi:hypothetical protein
MPTPSDLMRIVDLLAGRRRRETAFGRESACCIWRARRCSAPRRHVRMPVPFRLNNAQTATHSKVRRRRSARSRYDVRRTRLLVRRAERRYFGDVDATIAASSPPMGYALESATICWARDGDDSGRVYFVRERMTPTSITPPTLRRRTRPRRCRWPSLPRARRAARQGPRQAVPRLRGRRRAIDAVRTYASTVKKVEFYPGRIDVILTFVERRRELRHRCCRTGKQRAARRSRRHLPHPRNSRTGAMTDKRRLFEGIPLAPNAQYTGWLAFSAPRIDDVKRAWSLTVAPALRDGSERAV